jgi:hypothetical protein
MPWKPRVTGGLARCGRCGKRYSNPLTHVCVTRLDSKRRPGRTKVAPKASVTLATCGRCGKAYSNPLTHVCAVKTDFKRRKTAEARRQKAAATPRKPAPPKHEYRTCADDDCEAFPCKIYREAFQAGRELGHQEGEAETYPIAYAEGYAAGAASAARR